MSSDIYAKPDFSKKVRYTRKEEWQENEVDIYESADDIGIHHFQSHDGGPQNEKQPPAVHRKRFSSAVFCLGVLCFLMLTAIIILSTCYILVTVEKDQLQNRYNTLNTSHTQLQETFSEKRCPDGWTRFGCSCYFRSNGMKLWYQSRTDCQSKGADLVVINSEDENKFVSGLNMYGQFWIGLKTELSSDGRSYEWKWVDGSPLTETFWAAGLQRASSDHYAAYSNQHGRWTQSYHVNTKPYICEKQVSCIL
ncbi:C-type lectin domain family 6 member A-like isoform 1-T1 [Acanthopagrus schlegelii]